MKNIYLIGMMGSGKSSSGRILARLAGMQFTDLDEIIMETFGKSINEIFRTEGENRFREVESDLLTKVSSCSGCVVATGGGIVLNPRNCQRMKETGTVLYLKTGLDALWARVKTKRDRPLLATPDPKHTLMALSRERILLYEAVSDRVFLTDGKSPADVAREIHEAGLELYEKN